MMNKLLFKSLSTIGWTAALVTGCTILPSVGPDYERPDFEDPGLVLPDAGAPTLTLNANHEYTSAATNEDRRVVISKDLAAQWWKRFDDPVLEMIVNSAVTNNVSFQMAVARLDQADWELLGSYAAFLPKLTGNGAWNRYWNRATTPNGVSAGGKSVNYNATQAALDGNWELDIFGGNRRLTEAAIAQAEAAGWTVADAWLELVSQIGRQYINLRTTQERIQVARVNLTLQSETYDILKSRFDSGIGDELAVNQCAYIVEQTRARIPQMLAEEERLKNALAILAGEMPGALHDWLKAPETPRDWMLAPQRVQELPLDMMRSRPDVQAAERSLAAQVARIGVAKAQWFPKLFVSGSVGYVTEKRTKIFSPDSFFATLGPAISWPIFQGGAIYANVKATEAKAREAALAYELALENAYAEVRNCYSAYTQEYHRYQSLKGAVKAASDAVTISQDLYKNGLKDFNNVLDAQRSRLQLEEELVISRGQITADLIELYRALGGGLAKSE